MNVWIALLRGINVGGHRKMPMAALRTVAEAAGFVHPATYVQSGNLVVRSEMTERVDVEAALTRAIADHFGFDVPVIARDLAGWDTIVRDNPFADAAVKPAARHVFVLHRPADAGATDRLAGPDRVDEEFTLIGKTLYLCTPSGIGRSKFAASVERLLGVPATARNWNTVLRLHAMASHATDQ